MRTILSTLLAVLAATAISTSGRAETAVCNRGLETTLRNLQAAQISAVNAALNNYASTLSPADRRKFDAVRPLIGAGVPGSGGTGVTAAPTPQEVFSTCDPGDVIVLPASAADYVVAICDFSKAMPVAADRCRPHLSRSC